MSPEQLRGGERITAASDIYSMAVIAYEMITGRRPFNPSSAPQLLELHREGVRLNPIDLRPNLSTEARAILLCALSFDPAARYQSAAEFGDHLARALTDGREPIRIAPLYPVQAETIQSKDTSNATTTIAGQPTGRLLKYLLSVLLVAVVGITAAIYLRPGISKPPDNKAETTPQPTPTAIPTPPARSFNYWLDVQKINSGKPYHAYLSSGKDDIFETGDRFRLNVSSPEPGFLYLFNEGSPSRSGTSFTILYPLPSINEGSATLGGNQTVQSGWNKFAREPGTENFWIVWSTSTVPELEAAKAEAFKHPYGGLTGDTLAATKRFLLAKKEEVKTKYATNKDTHQITVRGNGDLLVRMVEFQHR
jgi:serine/threonine protein kinase